MSVPSSKYQAALISITEITNPMRRFSGVMDLVRVSLDDGWTKAFAAWCWQHADVDSLVLSGPNHLGTTPDLARQVYHRLLIRFATEELSDRQKKLVKWVFVGSLLLLGICSIVWNNNVLFGFLSAIILFPAYGLAVLHLIPSVVRGSVTDEIRKEVIGIVRRCFLRESPDGIPDDLDDVWRHGWITSECAPVSSELTDTDSSSTAAQDCVEIFTLLIRMAIFLPLAVIVIPMVSVGSSDLTRRRNEIEKQRAVEGSLFIAAGGPAWARLQEEARKEQMVQACRDTTALVNMGTTTGILAARGDLFAPSGDLPFRLSLRDLQNHVLVFGGTGSGKTSGILRPLAQQIARWRNVGMVVMDGKGALPRELEGLSGMQVIDPQTTVLSMVRDLTPVEVVDSIVELLGRGGTDRFWTDGAAALVRHAAVLAHGAGGSYWTLENIGRALSDAEFRQELIEHLPETRTAEMTAAIEFFEKEWKLSEPEAPRTQRSPESDRDQSALSMATAWMSAAIRHPDLVGWLKRIRDLSPEEVIDPVVESFGQRESDRTVADRAVALLRHAVVLTHAAGETFWTVENIVSAMARADFRRKLLQSISPTVALSTPEIEKAIDFFVTNWKADEPASENKGQKNARQPEMDRTQLSLLTIAKTWMSTIMGHPDLLRWAQASDEAETVNLYSPLEGGRIGFLIPAYRYGRAGSVVAALLKARLYSRLKRRADQKRTETDRDIMFIIDEAQEIATDEDATMLAIGRSLGLGMIAATQTVEGVEERLGEKTAGKWLSIFGTVVTLPGRSAKTDGFTASRVGLTWSAVVQHRPGTTLRETMQRGVLTGLTAANRFQGLMAKKDETPRLLRGVMAAMKRDAEHEPSSGIGPHEMVNYGEMLTLLAKPDTALIVATRARVPRRDIVQLKPVYEIETAK